ncbi:Mpt5 protein [Maudiozyma humilis]|uniref:Mpt5 protein n=1 Tax=Maudiozyma humilis TaxID=51915 RepID=A0AAV5RRQ7_MAUHU|nr:Mpt5 protein [Kazachstania humilis]
MAYSHQSHCSVNSVQSIIEPVTPPASGHPGPSGNPGNPSSLRKGAQHGKSRSLDLGGASGVSGAPTHLSPGISSPGLSLTMPLPLISEAASNRPSHDSSYGASHDSSQGIAQGNGARAGNTAHTAHTANATRAGGYGARQQGNAGGDSVPNSYPNSYPNSSAANSNSSHRGSRHGARGKGSGNGNAHGNGHSRSHSGAKGKGRGNGNGRRRTSSSGSHSSSSGASEGGMSGDSGAQTVLVGSTSASASNAEISATPLEELDYVKLATDQFGCRFLQKKLEAAPRESCLVRDLMFAQIKPYFINLILDPFGNYLVQKLCEYLTTDQKTQLIDTIYPHVFKISINQYGTRSLQKIIDTVDNDDQIARIVQGFSPPYTSIDQIVVLVNDLNGNHVIQKCIFKFPAAQFGFIIDAIVDRNNIVAISTHKHGCCVLQKLLSVCTLQQIFDISVKIVQCIQGLINDQFGNYIIQFLLDIRELDFFLLPEIFNKLSGDLCQLSCLKFSSNVIEKFIKKLFGVVIAAVRGEAAPNMSDTVMNTIMNILLTIIDIFTMKLNILIRDNYGNYALQTLLDAKHYAVMLEYPGNDYIRINNPKFINFAHDFTERVHTLVCMTKDLLPSIKTTSYAKKIKLKVKGYSEICGLDLNEAKQVHMSPSTASLDTQGSASATAGVPVAAGLTPLKGSTPTPSTGVVTPTTSITLEVNGQRTSNASQQHQRHVSLPANAYHRRSSSSVMQASGTAFLTLNTTPQQLGGNGSGIQTSLGSMMASQDSSPLSITQSQQMDLLGVGSNSFMPMPMQLPVTMPVVSSRVLSTQNGLGLGLTDEFDLARPLANLSLNSSMPSQSMFFANDNNATGTNSNNTNTNNQRNMSTSSSSSNVLQNNYSSASSSTINSSIPNNFMTTPNLMNTSNIAFTPSDRITSSNFNDFKNVALQPQQRMTTSQYAGNQNLGYDNMGQTKNEQGSTESSTTSPQFYSNGVAGNNLMNGMNAIPQSNGQDMLSNSFGFY